MQSRIRRMRHPRGSPSRIRSVELHGTRPQLNENTERPSLSDTAGRRWGALYGLDASPQERCGGCCIGRVSSATTGRRGGKASGKDGKQSSTHLLVL